MPVDGVIWLEWLDDSEQEIGKNVEGSGRGLIYWTIPAFAWTGEYRKNFNQDSWCPSPDLNWSPLEYKPEALTLDWTWSVFENNKIDRG
jgi:hypothetical protein